MAETEQAFRPDTEMFVCMDNTGCYHVSWNAEQHAAKMAQVSAKHEARYIMAPSKPPHQEEGEVTDIVGRLFDRSANAHLAFYTNMAENRALDQNAARLIRSQASQIEALRKERDELRAAVSRLCGKGEALVGYLDQAAEEAASDYLAWRREHKVALNLFSKSFLDAKGGGQ